MTTKEKLLTLFEKNKGVYFSRRCLHQRSPSGKSRRRSAGGLLGIGINVYPPENGFPEELKNIAGAVFSEAMGDGKNRLAAAFLNCFMALCQSLEDSSYIQEYRERSFLIGREILVLLPEGTKKASALDVDGECRLIVRYKDGTVAALDSGEVRVQERKHLHTPTE
ncbi:MAG: biotin--[acetyl-CoA-carboxylase] ligase [Blautia sp.]